jgi:hypothetical protein
MYKAPFTNPLEEIEINLPDTPIDINLIFCEHDRAKSLPNRFGELAMNSDVIALETVGWSADGARLRQSIADGDQSALRQMSSLLPRSPQGGFWRSVHRGIFNSGARIHYPDVPQNHAAAGAYIAAVESESVAVAGYSYRHADDPKILIPHLERTFAAIAARDVHILENLFPADISEESGKIRYLGMFGLLHRKLADTILAKVEEQDRDDIDINSYESGETDPTAYERYLDGFTPTAEDVVKYYKLEENS